ncbi:MAG: large protein, partial [Chitinophagaceae bacterium]|nr:large protein [Chitinophagaceae bacterium]
LIVKFLSLSFHTFNLTFMNKKFYTFLILVSGFLSTHSSLQAQNNTVTFDGATDLITVPHSSSYDLGTGDFTVEAIVNIKTGNSGYIPLLSTRTIVNGPIEGFIFYIYSGNELLLQMNGNSSVYTAVSSQSLQDDQCHHVAASRSSAGVKFYLDGVYKGTVAGGGNTMTSPGPLYFGYDSYDSYFLDGSISEVRLWNIAQSDANILANYNSQISGSSTGLIGLWRLEEASGQVVADNSPTANSGVLGTTINVEASDPTRVALCSNGIVTGLFDANTPSSKLSVAPNPFQEETKVTIDASAADYLAEVYTLEGQLVQSAQISNVNEFQLGGELRPGLYVLKVSSNALVQTTRILKK